MRRDRAADDAVQIGADAVRTALVDRVARDTAPEDLFAHRCRGFDGSCFNGDLARCRGHLQTVGRLGGFRGRSE